MESGSSRSDEIAHDFAPFFKVYRDGRVERFMIGGGGKIPTGTDSVTGVQSKDVVISSESGVSARIFLQNKIEKKVPLLIHYHGGGFCAGSPFDSITQGFLTKMASLANVVAISVHYRLGPENPLPTAHEDALEALKWIATHGSGNGGPEPWINQYVDLDRVFLTGESAGANIAHYVAVKAGTTKLSGVKLTGIIIVHPFFAGKEPDKMIMFMYPTTSGTDSDPLLSAVSDPNVSEMAGDRALVCVAEKDWLKDRGVKYYETLCSVWNKGKVELVESAEEDHCFHMFKANDKAEQLIQRMVDFINKP